MHSKQKGNIGQTQTVLVLQSLGYNVFSELGDLSKVDLVSEKDGKLLRFQVKACSPKNGKISVPFKKDGPNYSFKYTKDQFDFFAICNLDSLRIAFIPSCFITKQTSITLRCLESKNKQKSNIHIFEEWTDFERILRDHTRDACNGDDMAQTTTQKCG